MSSFWIGHYIWAIPLKVCVSYDYLIFLINKHNDIILSFKF
jgi:hypothetical protein